MINNSKDYRKEKMAQLILKNKIRLARLDLIQWYQQNIGYTLTIGQFIDWEEAQRLKSKVYRHAWTQQGQQAANFSEIRRVLASIRQQTMALAETWVICYYPTHSQAGAFKIKLKDFWNLLEKIDDDPGDIIVVKRQFNFYICIEAEEYNYHLTLWGDIEEINN